MWTTLGVAVIRRIQPWKHLHRGAPVEGARKEQQMQFIFAAQVRHPIPHLPSDSSGPLATGSTRSASSASTSQHITFRLTTAELRVTVSGRQSHLTFGR
jgi:hypothetical protein